jgi:hypothetical protein
MLALMLILSLLGGPAGAQDTPAASPTPASLAANEVNALVARVALYPDPLLALVLQGSTLPLQVVQAARFLDRRARDTSLQPDTGWDTSIVGLLNYPTAIAMMNEDLDWTEALGTAVVNQLPDVQAAVQQVRSELQAAGTLVSNERQTVVTDQDTIRIEPANRDVIYVPMYEPVPQQALPAAAPEAAAPAAAPIEAAPAAPPTAYAAPAPTAYPAPVPTTYAVPQVTYSDPYASFWTHGAAFAGGAVIGGVLGYAIGEDDDDDDDFEIDIDEDIDWDDVDWDDIDRGGIESSRSRDINIEDSNVVVGGNRSKVERQTQLAQSQLRANQQRKGSVSSRQATQARAQVARQPAASTRPAEAGTRRPAASTSSTRQPQQRRVSQQPAGTTKKSAFDAKPRQEVRKEAQRGSQSRSAARPATTPRPQVAAQRQASPRPTATAASAQRQAAARPQAAHQSAFAGQSRSPQRDSGRGAHSRGGGRGGDRGR